MIDPRVIKVGIEFQGRLKVYSDLDIKVSGVKFANPLQNECTVEISNVEKETRNFILTETSPFNSVRTPKRIVVEAGRLNTGASQVFIGDVVSSSVSQPPDIKLTLKALTSDAKKGDIVARSGGDKISLRALSEIVASDIGANLEFQATDKTLENYSFTGGALKQVNELGKAGLVDVFVDDNTLIVKDMNAPLSGVTRVLNKDTGLIGIPELTEHGVKARFLWDNQTRIGGAMSIESEINPTLNGDYAIYKLSYELANRSEPFYYIAEGKRL